MAALVAGDDELFEGVGGLVPGAAVVQEPAGLWVAEQLSPESFGGQLQSLNRCDRPVAGDLADAAHRVCGGSGRVTAGFRGPGGLVLPAGEQVGGDEDADVRPAAVLLGQVHAGHATSVEDGGEHVDHGVGAALVQGGVAAGCPGGLREAGDRFPDGGDVLRGGVQLEPPHAVDVGPLRHAPRPLGDAVPAVGPVGVVADHFSDHPPSQTFAGPPAGVGQHGAFHRCRHVDVVENGGGADDDLRRVRGDPPGPRCRQRGGQPGGQGGAGAQQRGGFGFGDLQRQGHLGGQELRVRRVAVGQIGGIAVLLALQRGDQRRPGGDRVQQRLRLHRPQTRRQATTGRLVRQRRPGGEHPRPPINRQQGRLHGRIHWVGNDLEKVADLLAPARPPVQHLVPVDLGPLVRKQPPTGIGVHRGRLGAEPVPPHLLGELPPAGNHHLTVSVVPTTVATNVSGVGPAPQIGAGARGQ